MLRDTVLMTVGGTAAYRHERDLPPLVAAAVEVAVGRRFEFSCSPSTGRLLQLLASGVDRGAVGETGTGCGVGLAWLVSGVQQEVAVVSVEHDRQLVDTATSVFADVPAVRILHGDWTMLRSFGPFALLFVDGGGHGKSSQSPLRPEEWLVPGGTLVIDDFTPFSGWPPMHNGQPDDARLHWLEHPRLLATELRVEPTSSTIVATLKP